MKKYCIGYTGEDCTNGLCPNALADEFPDSGYHSVECKDCPHYFGCLDCLWEGTDICTSLCSLGGDKA